MFTAHRPGCLPVHKMDIRGNEAADTLSRLQQLSRNLVASERMLRRGAGQGGLWNGEPRDNGLMWRLSAANVPALYRTLRRQI